MGELDNDELKHNVQSKRNKIQKRIRSFAQSKTGEINDDDYDCLPEHSIPKKKKKKKKRVNEKESIDRNDNTQIENHGENINQMTECNGDIHETNEKNTRKIKKSSRNSHLFVGDESKHCESDNAENSSNSNVKKKKKKNTEKDENSDVNPIISNYHSNLLTKHTEMNTIIHHEIENLEDNCNYQDNNSSSKTYSKELNMNANKDYEKPEESHSRNTGRNRKRSKKTKTKKLIGNSDSETDSNVNGQETEDRISNKLQKGKNGRRTEKVASQLEIEPEIEIKKEKVTDNENESDSSEGIIIDEDGPLSRVRKAAFTATELKLARIVAYDETDSEEEIHPLQQHHPLDPESAAKLAAICINLKHKVPPQHQVEKLAGTRVPTKKEKEEMQKYIEMKKGPFSPEEDSKILRNWNKFCKRYDWDREVVHPFLHLKQKGFFYLSAVEERRKFVKLLAKGLPNRTLYSVYHRFRNIFSNHKQERYSADEDRELLRSIKSNLEQGEKPNYAILAKKFNRTRASVWRRYVLLMKKRRKEGGLH